MVEIKEALTADTPSASAVEEIAKKPRTITEILTAQLAALQTYHRAVLETDEPEAIHKMRVTTRRAQAALDLLEGELRVRKLKRRLRELAANALARSQLRCIFDAHRKRSDPVAARLSRSV